MADDAVALITDIHANVPALEASLTRIEELGIERIYCGGDLVGYGPRPNEVCALIEQRGIPTIYGNYDYAIARDDHDCGCAYIDQHDRELGQESVEWTLVNTSQESKDFMRELPFDLHFEVGDVRVHLVHGSPRKVNEYLFEDKRASLYERLAGAENDRVMLFGHTHKPWVHEYGGVLFVNCGSVGKPKDGDPRGAFAVLQPAGETVDATIDRVSYDAGAVAAEVRQAGLPDEFANKLLLSNTFAGIAAASVPPFIAAQLIGGVAAVLAIRALYPDVATEDAAEVVLPPAADGGRPRPTQKQRASAASTACPQ